MKSIHLFFSMCVLLLCFNSVGYSQNQLEIDSTLQELLEDVTKDFKGDLGLYVRHLPSGREVSIQADTIFPTASIVKIPILLGIFNKIEKGELDYRQPLVYRDSIKYGGSGLMQNFQDSSKTDLSVLIALMLNYSDNTTSLWNQALAGSGTEINKVLEENGFKDTRVNSRTPGREKMWEIYGWGQTTPREMSEIMIKIWKGTIISPAASETMFRILSNSFYWDYATSQIPPGVNVASKQGMVNKSRSEVLFVNAPEGEYVWYIATKNNEDESWDSNNEAWVLTKKISGVLWNYFNPDHPYKPESGMEKYLNF